MIQNRLRAILCVRILTTRKFGCTETDTTIDTKPEITIIEFTPELAGHFKSINTEWISEMFEIEDSEREVLNNPQKVIINSGGKIYFARHPTLGIIGTCALLRKDAKTFELTKMGVLKKSRGLKAGELLLQHVINQSKIMGIDNLFLLTNKKCEAAIHLYEKLGFIHDVATMENYAYTYKRVDVAMRLV